MSSQVKKIQNHLLAKGSITSMEAWSLYRITRLAARIYDLRDKMSIKTVMMDNKGIGKHAKYYIN